jgi:hypothetical protein
MTEVVICPKCEARAVLVGNEWREEASEIPKCRDLPGTERWAKSADITWCPTLAAEAFKRGRTWNGHAHREQVLAEIAAAKAAKVKKD